MLSVSARALKGFNIAMNLTAHMPRAMDHGQVLPPPE